MKENIVIVNFKVESEAYEALSQLKSNALNENYTVLQAQVVKRNNSRLETKDGFATGVSTTDDTWKGGVIGALVGILGGPLGVLLGGSVGALIGEGVDAGDAVNEESLLEKAADCITEGETALLILVQEEDEDGLNLVFSRYDAAVTRFDAAEVAAEVDHANEVQKQVAKEAKEKLRAEKNESFREAVGKKREELKEKFSKFSGKNEK